MEDAPFDDDPAQDTPVHAGYAAETPHDDAVETSETGDALVGAISGDLDDIGEPATGDSAEFDSFEAELSADLDDFRTQLASPMPPEDLRQEPVDSFPEIEADFDDAADDFLAEEDLQKILNTQKVPLFYPAFEN